MSILQKIKRIYLNMHDESYIIVSRMKIITMNIFLLFQYSLFKCLPLQKVHGLLSLILALLLVVLCRMFSHHVCLEVRRCGALVVAVSTGKRLLSSHQCVFECGLLDWKL